jgi:hypothetical protein
VTEEHDPHISKLYRATRDAEPPSALDAKILEQANRAVRHRRRRWMLPLSTVAVVMIGLTLTLKMVDMEPRLSSPEDFAVEEEALMEVPETKSKAPQPMRQERAAPAAAKKEKRMRAAEPVLEMQPQLDMAPSPSREKSLQAPTAPSSTGVAEEGRVLLKEEQASDVEFANPEEWLREIEQMVEADKLEQARVALERFREVYPDYPVPEKLVAIENRE